MEYSRTWSFSTDISEQKEPGTLERIINLQMDYSELMEKNKNNGDMITTLGVN